MTFTYRDNEFLGVIITVSLVVNICAFMIESLVVLLLLGFISAIAFVVIYRATIKYFNLIETR
jgi:hypothetical protein